jgi:chaperone BCS1
MQAILDDYRDFVSRMRWYAQRGVPFRRGYLLHGTPGCGKTHFCKLLAGRTSSDLYVIDLSSASSLGITDDNISDVVRSLPPRSILLLKNVDVFVSARGAKGGKSPGSKGKDAADGTPPPSSDEEDDGLVAGGGGGDASDDDASPADVDGEEKLGCGA